jgi:coatomer protein complex subunit gamma
LEQNLFKNNQEAVALEAVRGILELPSPKEELLKKTFVAAQMLLSSSKTLHKFAALRTLDKVAKKYSKIAYDIFLDLEKIIDDTTLNMSIKTIAISIFLKISEELSNSRLEKLFSTICEQYGVFREEFKKEIITISKNICRDHPNKQSVLISLI